MVTIRKWPRDPERDHAHLFALEDPRLIAESLKRMAETSQCQGTPYERAMKILSDYVDQDGTVLSTRQHQIIEEVKDWLRDLFMVRG
ncbi:MULTISPECIES: DUF3175 domain-containing protein [Asticcacaulis]|uniref:DUF3175 domain-containing protein n=1 Tax=Asticcacaulis TaxID=76890 RepID=UPI001AE51384|nr:MULTISPECIES: DUF3175 domain-containing protein [Asticcacaulis]MBP2159650.1 hypothetical protein [Asticcacaulis solisilvae]MDR6800523.1 hypothetical protein [Asticcacaulis sp. BE141]